MDSPTRQRYETQSQDLRSKIKSWEVNFCRTHNGNKPSREDIKEHEMSGTYKEYQRLRDILSGKLPPPPPPPPKPTIDETHHRKRKSPEQQEHDISQTPSTKRFKPVETPSLSRQQNHGDSIAMNMFTPGSGGGLTPSLSRKLFHSSPAIPTSIGPTPQRDGLVLGLFDSLPFKNADIDSPSKPNGAVRLSEVIEAGRKVMETQQTPRKTSKLSEGNNFLGKTPTSRHKRHGGPSPRKSLLSTPLKLDGANRVAKTPGTSGSASGLQFQTPAFLRRIPMPKIDENTGAFVSPELKMRLPPKPLLRGLSSVVADLRRMQEEELDEELEALREAEMEMEGGGGPSKPVNRTILSDKTNLPATNTTTTQIPLKKQDDASILEEDSEKQALNLLGGFDDEGDYDSAGEKDAGLDRNGNPLRVYKKKGQKRTTRKSNMKPVMKRRATTTADAEDDNDENAPSARRTRAGGARVDGGEIEQEHEDNNDDDDDAHSGSEFAGSDDEDELALDNTTTTKGKGKGRKPAAAKKAASTKTTKAAPAAKKAPRKVNEHAHANFKRLKLRNSGAKGGPGYNSRFKRRR